MKTLYRSALLCLSLLSAPLALATALDITLSPAPGGKTYIEWSGSGVFGGLLQSPGMTLNFTGFNPGPFLPGINKAQQVPTGPGLLTFDVFNSSAVPSAQFQKIQFKPDDIIHVFLTSQVNNGNTFLATSTPMVILDIDFADLILGTYTDLTSPDAVLTGGVTLHIVPIPAAFWFFVSALGLLGVARTRNAKPISAA
jgi:hypothetical protein